MHQVYPYDLGKVCLLNLTLFLHIPQHKYSVFLLTKFVGLFTSSLLCIFLVGNRPACISPKGKLVFRSY